MRIIEAIYTIANATMRIALRSLFLVISATVIAVFLSGCGPHAEGSYRGAVLNQSHGVSADLFITLSEHNGVVVGNMTIGAPLYGGGAVAGSRAGKQLQFVTSDSSGGRISWYGTISGSRIEGQYVVEPSGLNMLMTGVEKQQGVWSVTR